MKILLYLIACLKTDNNEMHDPAFTERLEQQPSLAEYLSSGTHKDKDKD